MSLPIHAPFPPMEARLVDEIPAGPLWQYEPKWDGFRCLIFRDGGKIELQSKAGQQLTRYFPELVQAVGHLAASRFVLDGEVVIPVDQMLSFDELLLRIHPAASRVQKLAREHPAMFVAFDLLVGSRGESLFKEPLKARRRALEEFAAAFLTDKKHFRLSPATRDIQRARQWFSEAGGNLDGIVAKPLELEYRSGERAMEKIKPIRTADCVIGGFRYAAKKKVVGSLLLGLYDDAGLLNHVGFCSSFKTAERKSILARLIPLIQPPGFTGRAPGGPSRWSGDKSMEWEPLRPELVVEVAFDHFTGGRFRHGTKLLRWRPDKAPRQCKMDQVLKSGGGFPVDL